MAVKVLISRRFKGGKLEEAQKLLMEMRSVATLQPGYISGQTLIGVDNPDKVVVVSTWTGKKPWLEWLTCERRKELSGRLAEFLEDSETVETFWAGAQ
ncbi:MAG: antibiotic biosynthesis monooxygenase [Pseudomonadota bacterium]|jgi:heme oxygenase (mycobilin-producing)